MWDIISIITVSLLASVIGAICGIGGGIIIKPVLDSLGIMSIEAVSFLSGCTVLCMSGYSILSAIYKKELKVSLTMGVSISSGAVVGGILGGYLFKRLKEVLPNTNNIGVVQSICLFWLTFAVLLYTMNRDKIKTYYISNSFVNVLAGIFLGVLSSFLGIGGGPFNLVLLTFLFSMGLKEAAQNSLLIILFAQISNILLRLTVGVLPDFNPSVFAGMAVAGIVGAIIGRKVNVIIKETTVDRLFRCLNVLIMIICIYNYFKYI